MTFDEALSYLLSLGHETLAIKLGLAGVEQLLDALSRPERQFPAVQIAGTNGKGSTAAMLDAICRAAGVRTGLYTSPHLISVTERIRIGGVEIGGVEFARLVARVRGEALRLREETGALPTFFEQVTAVALLAFAEGRVELAILETGLGGRLDATTAAGASIVAITPVALDHQEYLGTSLGEIAAEKAAIIRPRCEAIVAPQETAAHEVILARCHEVGVSPRPAAEVSVEGATADGRTRVTLRTDEDAYERVTLALRGRHQATNAAVAVALAEALRMRGFAKITRAAIIAGLEAAEHRGRLELIAGRPAVLLDGAHNLAGAVALRAYLDEFAGAPITLLFGAMRDKDLAGMAEVLFPAASHLVLTAAANPRSAAPEMLAALVPASFNRAQVAVVAPARAALSAARATTPLGGLVCATGSLYLVGEIRGLLAAET